MAELTPDNNFTHQMNDHHDNNDDDNTILDYMIMKLYKLDVEPCRSRANRFVII